MCCSIATPLTISSVEKIYINPGHLVVLEIVDISNVSCQQNPQGTLAGANLEAVLRVLGEVVHVLDRADASLPRLMHGVGVGEKSGVPVHVDDVVEPAQGIVIDLGPIFQKHFYNCILRHGIISLSGHLVNACVQASK